MADATLTAQPRTDLGKRPAGRARRDAHKAAGHDRILSQNEACMCRSWGHYTVWQSGTRVERWYEVILRSKCRRLV